MPAWGNSSPVVCNGRIFVCAEPSTLVCVNADDGKLLWHHANNYEDLLPASEREELNRKREEAKPIREEMQKFEQQYIRTRRKLRDAPEDAALKQQVDDLKKQVDALKAKLQPLADAQMPPTHGENGYSSATPVTDGKHVFALFGNGVAVCYDFDGNRKWARLVERPTAGWGQSSSPLRVGDKLVVLINSLHALDPNTGATKWTAPSIQRWGTPVAARVGEIDVVVTPCGDFVRASDGKVLQSRMANLDYCAPVVQGGIAYFIENNGKAVKLSANVDGLTAEPLWTTTPPKERYYASPIIHDGLVFCTTQHGDFSVLDAKTGEIVHQRKLEVGGTVYSSITLAKDLLYVTGENGRTFVLRADKEATEVAKNQLEPFRCSPVFIGDRMYVKTKEKLYCIGK